MRRSGGQRVDGWPSMRRPAVGGGAHVAVMEARHCVRGVCGDANAPRAATRLRSGCIDERSGSNTVTRSAATQGSPFLSRYCLRWHAAMFDSAAPGPTRHVPENVAVMSMGNAALWSL
ncbi:hypothetical protein XCCB100_3568 [Xanthomonas campestris pv. campestris]|uniref:Uncharacterized protein n=1 Tax=Xanthomonas campestris pv. campestris (strain B100) TaxID=509169 RepID=B0RUJ1_XANCB|nr:hypothetical protein XCCB100_3568 [Xanthomonas campestris pv. campestris]